MQQPLVNRGAIKKVHHSAQPKLYSLPYSSLLASLSVAYSYTSVPMDLLGLRLRISEEEEEAVMVEDVKGHDLSHTIGILWCIKTSADSRRLLFC